MCEGKAAFSNRGRSKEGAARMTTKWMAYWGLLGLLALAAIGGRAAAEGPMVELKVGDAAPTFEAVDDQGQPWKSADHVGKQYVVVYFFPATSRPDAHGGPELPRRHEPADRRGRRGGRRQRRRGCDASDVQEGPQAQLRPAVRRRGAIGGDVRRAGGKRRGGEDEGRRRPAGDGEAGRHGGAWTFIIGKDGRLLYKNTQVDPAKDSKEVADLIDHLNKP